MIGQSERKWWSESSTGVNKTRVPQFWPQCNCRKDLIFGILEKFWSCNLNGQEKATSWIRFNFLKLVKAMLHASYTLIACYTLVIVEKK